MPVEQLVSSLCDLKQRYTQVGGMCIIVESIKILFSSFFVKSILAMLIEMSLIYKMIFNFYKDVIRMLLDR